MEIKQTILQPFGAREELGNSTSNWTLGGGIIGSSGGGASLITIPTPNAGETATEWAARVTQLGLVASFVSSVPNSLGAEYNNKLEQSSPAVGTAVAAGSTVQWWSYVEYVAPGTTVTLTTGSVVNQSTQGMTAPLKGRAALVNVVGGEQGGTLYTSAATNGLVGKTITLSSDVNGTPGADGGELSYFAGQTFTITASSSGHQDEVPGMFPASDTIRVEWTASGPNYGFSQFTAGTATISA